MIRDLWELLHLLLDNNVFSYNNLFFKQVRENDHPEKEVEEVIPSATFKILKEQRDLLKLHIQEAMAIHKRKPTLHCRLETLSTGFLI